MSRVHKPSPAISIVDDDEGVRASLESYLRSAGVEVHTFGSAEAFLISPKRLETACLVTDLHMPGMDGLALQQELNRIGRTFPVIVMTAFPTGAARAQSASLGASAFLAKPIDPDALLDRIEEICEGKRDGGNGFTP